MKIFLMLMNLTFKVFANSQTMNPLQLKLDKEYATNKIVIETCLNGESSSDPQIGCVGALNYFTNLCKLKGNAFVRNSYLPRQEIYFTQACKFLEESYTGRAISFFDLDGKTCRKGFESIGDRMVSLHQSKEIIDETYFYFYERKSCKEYRRFVYLCEYIDGGLRTSIPKTNKLLPKIDFATNQQDYCFNKNDGISVIGKDLLADRNTYTQNIYEKAILAGRSRMPSSNSISKECEQIRNSYNNFSCNRFDKIDLEKDEMVHLNKPEEKPAATAKDSDLKSK